MTDDTHKNEFYDLVRRTRESHANPITPGWKVGIQWASAELTALREENRRMKKAINMDYRDLVDESFDIGGWNKLTAEEQWAVRNTFIELRRRSLPDDRR
jgi:hypothetical protein